MTKVILALFVSVGFLSACGDGSSGDTGHWQHCSKDKEFKGSIFCEWVEEGDGTDNSSGDSDNDAGGDGSGPADGTGDSGNGDSDSDSNDQDCENAKEGHHGKANNEHSRGNGSKNCHGTQQI